MCCEESVERYSAAVAKMVAAARRAARDPGADSWNGAPINRLLHFVGEAPLARLTAGFSHDRGVTGAEVAQALVDSVDLEQVRGLIRLELGAGEPSWILPARAIEAARGSCVAVPVLVGCRADEGCSITIGEESARIARGEYALLEAILDDQAPVIRAVISGHEVTSGEFITWLQAGWLDLSAEQEVRWYVRSAEGQPCFPAEARPRWDAHGNGYFHAQAASIALIPGEYQVQAMRGIEYRPFITQVRIHAGARSQICPELHRRMHPAEQGWWSADLHVHANYGGSYEVTADEAMQIQSGEGLDFMNLVAANNLTAHIHDVDLFRAMLDHALPGRYGGTTHIGVEYRSGLFGHVHVTGAQRDLGLYQSGHPQGEVHVDWPMIAEVAQSYADVGAVIGYCHPVTRITPEQAHLDADDLINRVLGTERIRTVDARCAVLDAALGLADSLDVLSNADDQASASLFRRIVGAGLRLAVSAGSDTMLSLRNDGIFSNPPGWVRMYAQTGEEIDLPRLQEAIRQQRTIATNGPWIELWVQGRGPGATVHLPAPTVVSISAHVLTDAACEVRLHDGSHQVQSWSLAAGEATEGCELSGTLEVAQSMVLTLEVDGEPGSVVLGDRAFAHTSPVLISVGGNPPRREEDVRWCLAWLERLQAFILEHGIQTAQHRDAVAVIFARAAATLQSSA